MSGIVSLRARLTAQVGRLRIDAELDTGEGTLVLIGPNGAGKSSLLSLILGTRRADTGRLEVGDTVLLDSERSINLPVETRRLGFVPQDYALFPHLTARENIDFALSSAPQKLPRAARAARINALLSDLGIETLGDRRPARLSGGEKQRVALARALSVGPRALLLDEPLAALDVHSRQAVRSFLAGYLRQLGLPTVIVTHDAADARLLGHRIAVMEDGRITRGGTWEQLVAHPASPFVREFVASAGMPDSGTTASPSGSID